MSIVKFIVISIVAFSLYSYDLNSQTDEFILYKDFLFFNSDLYTPDLGIEPAIINSFGFTASYKKQLDTSIFRQYELKLVFQNSDNSQLKGAQLLHDRGKYFKRKIFNIFQWRYGYALKLEYLKVTDNSNKYLINTNLLGVGINFFTGIAYRIGVAT